MDFTSIKQLTAQEEGKYYLRFKYHYINESIDLFSKINTDKL